MKRNPLRVIWLVFLLSALNAFSVQAADVISGIPRITDGDTIVIGTTTIRLQSIDAPETDQVCLDAKGDRWTCGIEARDRLAAHIAGRSLDCTPSGLETYRRTLAVCRLTGEDLNAWMVREGWHWLSNGTPKGTCPISKSPAPNSVGFGLALLSPPGIGGTVITRPKCLARPLCRSMPNTF